MKKEITITSMFGLTQQEIAMLLGVSLGQWSMFECGKRSLPLAADQKLAHLLSSLNELKNARKGEPGITAPQHNHEQYLKSCLNDTEFQLLLLEKKIAALNRKQDSAHRVLELVAVLDKHQAQSKTETPGINHLIARKAVSLNGSVHSLNCLKLKMRKEELEFKNSILLRELKDCGGHLG